MAYALTNTIVAMLEAQAIHPTLELAESAEDEDILRFMGTDLYLGVFADGDVWLSEKMDVGGNVLIAKFHIPSAHSIEQMLSEVLPQVNSEAKSYGQYFEVDMDAVLRERFAVGQGVIQLLTDMDDQMIASIIKHAVSLSEGKAFIVVPPQMGTALVPEKAMQAGKEAALATLAESTRPLLLMDEMCNSAEETAFAMGWNSVWASDENKQRWDALKQTQL